ncbi:LysR family transcriptional regulator [Paracoccus fistulariae]|uniref:LysR family transcriptional regulator n=1 Tax=Paracoccus fistulariae TaxID=658446 RepID=A0ABY7SPP0_9RHOB|nr:LysR family transcriptional regulator [Paracoccus fistulariae]MDB6180404.1 LysR family transcriptional regulator [Paracoccus fistulariae]WCR08483.1 LysR family transcriptional regulator [Paracoccus fistulariae]
MDLRQLRNFIQIVELSSITAAAQNLNIAQPALSRQVKALEAELKVPLLRRHGRGVMPTEEGIRLARRARAILEDVEDLARDVSGDRKTLSGALTLGLPPTVAEILATHLIERTLSTYPDVNLRIVSGFSGHVQDWLLRGKIDLGVAYDGQKFQAISTRPIIQEQLFLIQRPANRQAQDGVPIDAGDALRQPLILPNPEHGLRSRIETIAQERKIDLNVVLEIDILPTMLAFVERGLGHTILPLVSVIDHVRAGRLIARPIVRRSIDRRLVLMTPLNRPSSRLTTGFAEFLTVEVHKLVTSGQWPGTTL